MCRVLIICTDRFFAKKAKETLVIGDDIQSFQAPLRKGSCRRKPTEGLFFYNPSTTSWSPSPYTGEANSEPLSARPASVLRTLANPSNRCAVSEPVSATPASVLRTLANPFHHFVVPLPLHRGGRTPLGEACKRASHTRKSLSQERAR